MNATVEHIDGADLWFPPERMRHYQWAKVVAGLLMLAMFAGWMVLEWRDLFSRVVTAGLTVLTVWIVAASIAGDARRVRQRQLIVRRGELQAIWPGGNATVPLAGVAYARWQTTPDREPGLWLYDEHDHPLLHLDIEFLADEAEARDFLGWARRLSGARLDARWG